MKFDNETCPICGEGQWVDHGDGTHTFRHKNKAHNVTGMHYAVCEHCGTRGFLKGQIAANKKRIAEYEDSLRDYISPSNILRIRERYDLSQKDAAKLFQCGPTQFSKWERGIVAPTGATAVLLRLALQDTEVVRKLASEAGIAAKLPQVKAERAEPMRVVYIGQPQRFVSQKSAPQYPAYATRQFEADIDDAEFDHDAQFSVSEFVDRQAEMTAATRIYSAAWSHK